MDKELTADEIKELKRNARGILSNIRQRMLCEWPFIGNIAMKLEIVPIRDIRCRTASTDGTHIFFDIEFLSELSEEERLFIFAHEVWHNVLLHFIRRQNRDISLFNIATDLEVNNLLKKEKMNGPSNVCWPKQFGVPENLSAEEYYDLLLDETKQKHVKSMRSSESSDRSSSSKNGKDSKNGNSSSHGKLSGQFDKHEYSDGSSNGNDQINDVDDDDALTDKYGKIGFDEDYNPGISSDAAERIREAAISSAQMYERSRGNLPEHISQIVSKLKKPEIRWQEVLAQFVSRCIGEKRQWCPPNRRHIWHDVYLQSRHGERLKIAVGIDTSGSTQNDISKFLTELNSIVNSFGNYEIHLIQCDTEVEDYELYSNDNPLMLEHTQFKVSGGGGTILHPIFDYVSDNQFEIDAYVIFTDGYIEDFPKSDDPGKPTLWILTSDGNQNSIHFGEVLRFKDPSWNS